jgi:DNA repair exonuclease SbcCD nuclease subunit
MKICLLGDTHFGIRNDSMAFHRYYDKFYSEHFFDYLKENDIKTVIQLGDLFDRRKYINFISLAESRRYFFDRVVECGIDFHALIGNHDIFWKNSVNVNSPDLLLKDYDNITLWQEPGALEIDGKVFDMIPWICKENQQEIFDYINSSTSPLCIGHFELAGEGFQLMKGVSAHDGMNSSFLDRYDAVFSGHYHTQSESGNIKYLGTPYELFWSDYNDPKGFFIFDTDTSKVEFVKNEFSMFHKIFYDDSQEIPDIDFEKFRDAYIKVVVLNKQSPYLFDKLLDELYNVSPAHVAIIEDFGDDVLADFDGELIDQAEDTLTILSNYIDQQKINEPQKVKTLMHELYVEALSQETV